MHRLAEVMEKPQDRGYDDGYGYPESEDNHLLRKVDHFLLGP